MQGDFLDVAGVDCGTQTEAFGDVADLGGATCVVRGLREQFESASKVTTAGAVASSSAAESTATVKSIEEFTKEQKTGELQA